MRRTSAEILLMLRDHIANDWASLCRELDLSPNSYGTHHYILRAQLDALREAGLLVFDKGETNKWGSRETGIKGPIELSPQWEKIQTALGISLVQLAKWHPYQTMVVRPFFGLPREPSTKADIFVLMPFDANLKPIYDDHIKKIAHAVGLTVARADDFFTAHAVMSDVWAAIQAARAIIADCTGRNPNVFYEIGLAHVLGKDVILVTQNSDDVPFDLRQIRYIEYQYTPRGMSDFENRLTKTLRRIVDRGSEELG